MRNKAALIVSFGLIIAALVFGLFFYNARNIGRTIKVVGYSTHDFQADIVKWSFSFTTMVGLDGLKNGYTTMNEKLNTFQTIWDSLNISTKEKNIQPVSVRKRYGQYRKVEGYILEQNIFLITKELEKIKEIAVNPQQFSNKGLAFESSKFQYFSTKLPEIKKKLLGTATKNAIQRANEIASSMDSKVKNINSAKAGVFQITEPYSNQVSGYGMYQTSTKNKTIKVTVTAEFEID